MAENIGHLVSSRDIFAANVRRARLSRSSALTAIISQAQRDIAMSLNSRYDLSPILDVMIAHSTSNEFVSVFGLGSPASWTYPRRSSRIGTYLQWNKLGFHKISLP